MLTPDCSALPDSLLQRLSVAPSGCWEWIGCLQSEGYGTVTIRPRKLYVHRLVYELTVGPIPNGLDIDHLCRNRKCANPEHLEPVTRRENVLRGESPMAKAARKTHCLNGHPFDEKNTYLRLDGRGRMCRRCSVERSDTQSVYRKMKADPVRYAAYLKRKRAENAARRARYRAAGSPSDPREKGRTA